MHTDTPYLQVMYTYRFYMSFMGYSFYCLSSSPPLSISHLLQLDVSVAELEIYREKHTRLERQIDEIRTQLETVSKSLEEDQA